MSTKKQYQPRLKVKRGYWRVYWVIKDSDGSFLGMYYPGAAFVPRDVRSSPAAVAAHRHAAVLNAAGLREKWKLP